MSKLFMKYIGDFRTAGAPVCVTPIEAVKSWTGVDGDYWDLIESIPKGQTLCVFTDRRGFEHLFYINEAKEFVIFWEADRFVILEIVFAPEEYSVPPEGMNFKNYVDGPSLLRRTSFGGLTAVFDAALVGKSIPLTSTGVVSCAPFDKSEGFNAAVIDVRHGTWDAFGLRVQTRDLLLLGVLFERVT